MPTAGSLLKGQFCGFGEKTRRRVCCVKASLLLTILVGLELQLECLHYQFTDLATSWVLYSFFQGIWDWGLVLMCWEFYFATKNSSTPIGEGLRWKLLRTEVWASGRPLLCYKKGTMIQNAQGDLGKVAALTDFWWQPEELEPNWEGKKTNVSKSFLRRGCWPWSGSHSVSAFSVLQRKTFLTETHCCPCFFRQVVPSRPGVCCSTWVLDGPVN